MNDLVPHLLIYNMLLPCKKDGCTYINNFIYRNSYLSFGQTHLLTVNKTIGNCVISIGVVQGKVRF